MNGFQILIDKRMANERLEAYWPVPALRDELLSRAFLKQGGIVSSQAACFTTEIRGHPAAVVMRVEEKFASLSRIGYFTIPAFSRKSAVVLSGGVHGASPEQCGELIKELQREVLRGRGIDRLYIPRLSESIIGPVLPDLLRCGFKMHKTELVSRLAILGSKEETIAHLKKKRRYNINRQLARILESPDSCVQLFRTPAEIDNFIARVVPVQEETYQNKIAVTLANSAAVRELLRSGSQSDKVLCFTLEIGGQIAAFQIGHLARSEYVLGQIGFDRQFESMSPGMSLLYASIDELALRGAETLDFGSGDAQYKSVLATEVENEHSIVAFGSGVFARLDSMAHSVTRSLSGLLSSLFNRETKARIRKVWRFRLASGHSTFQRSRSDRDKQC